MFDLTGKTALVGGGCGLIGQAVVIALKEQGADASSVDIGKGADYKVNLVVDTALKKLFENVKPDIWVNASYPDIEDHLMVFEDCTKIAADSFANHISGGVIINIASIYGIIAPRFEIYRGFEYPKEPQLQYCMVKAGIIQMNKWIAAKYGPQLVRCNSVSPGGVYHPKQSKEWQQRYKDIIPLGDMADPEDVAATVVFLASDEARYITGVNIPVCGGITSL